jgi:hypothetical protein
MWGLIGTLDADPTQLQTLLCMHALMHVQVNTYGTTKQVDRIDRSMSIVMIENGRNQLLQNILLL